LGRSDFLVFLERIYDDESFNLLCVWARTTPIEFLLLLVHHRPFLAASCVMYHGMAWFTRYNI
jgi:hypothetical protein